MELDARRSPRDRRAGAGLFNSASTAARATLTGRHASGTSTAMSERTPPVSERSSLVLVSASPRRRWLLAKLGVAFEVLSVDIDERSRPGEPPIDFAQRMADEKAAAALPSRGDAWLLAADTVVAVDGASWGKPRDENEATSMLATLSGRRHTVYTGVTLLQPGGTPAARTVTATDVCFRMLSAAEIRAYIATGEPFDRAGAYAIQGEGAHLIDRLDGSYTNVIGLPLPEVAQWLRESRIL
jgi:septum formation protein